MTMNARNRNAMQFVTGRFAKVAPPKRLGSPLSLARLPAERGGAT